MRNPPDAKAGTNTSLLDESGPVTQRAPSTDYFAFYQARGRWAWRRVDQTGDLVESATGSFDDYAQCVADARAHGWEGNPLDELPALSSSTAR